VIKHYFYILFLFFSFSAFSQRDSLRYDKKEVIVKKFDTDKLKNFKQDKDFIYTREQEAEREITWVDRVLRWMGNKLLKFLEWLFGERRAFGIFGFIVKVFPYIVAVLMILLLLKVFLNVRFDNLTSKEQSTSRVHIEEEKEIIQNKDIKALISRALQANDYRLAIRYHYLYILQRLEIKQLIDWELQKTNHDYEREIQDKEMKKQFKDLTYLYDFVWYGHFNIEELDFDKAATQFSKMEKEIDKK